MLFPFIMTSIFLIAVFILTGLWKDYAEKQAKEGKRNPLKVRVRGVRAIAMVMWLVVIFSSVAGGLVERNDLGWITIVQFHTGQVQIRSKPGYFVQWFGEIWKYPKANTCFFSADTREGSPTDESIPVNFNDGGSGKFSNEFQDQLINGLYVTEPYTITEEYEEMVRDGKAVKKTKSELAVKQQVTLLFK